MIMLKRKRDPTFTISEKEALLNLVTTHYYIIESKKTDAVSMKYKTEEWRKIAKDFNAISSIYPRKWKVLKNCWENLKKKTKHELVLRNQQNLGTGGTPPKKEDPLINRVVELIQGRVSEFVNCSDSDDPQILDIVNGESKLKVELNKSSTTNQQSPDSQECHALSTPPSVQTSIVAGLTATSRSRRRQANKEKLGTSHITLSKENMKTSLQVNAHSEKEHQVKLKILRLQEEKEKEILKQEILKTKQEEIKLQILETQLKKLKD